MDTVFTDMTVPSYSTVEWTGKGGDFASSICCGRMDGGGGVGGRTSTGGALEVGGVVTEGGECGILWGETAAVVASGVEVGAAFCVVSVAECVSDVFA